MIYSFDIFDTCLIRTCGEAEFIFDILAREILGSNASLSMIADFKYIRIQGEKKARLKSQFEEVTIEEIYHFCNFSSLTHIGNDNILSTELLIEKQNLIPVYSIQKKIEKIHNSGNNVVFISDIYFHFDFIVDILKKYNLFKDGDKLYLSSEYRATKSSGSLFKIVRKDLSRNNFLWNHFGDNIHSDFLMPLRKGIIPHHVSHPYSFYENSLGKLDIDPIEHPLVLSSSVSRAICISQQYSKYIKFAADFIAPLYVPFVYNTLKDAESRGIKKLYFLARDGYVLYVIALGMKDDFPNLEFHYLYASRKALYLPSLKSITKDSIKSIINNNSSNSSNTIYDNLQIDVINDDISQLNPEDILDTPSYKEKIIKKWEEQKSNCLGYFVQEGVASNKKDVAIVDIRGTRKCQESISDILELNGYQRVFAYYFEADKNRITPCHTDEFSAFCFGDDKLSYYRKTLEASAVFFEKYFCISSFPRTCGYKKTPTGMYEPLFESNVHNNELYDSIKEINEKVCSQYYKLIKNTHIEKYFLTIQKASLANLAVFSASPHKEYISVFDNIYYSESSTDNQLILTGIFNWIFRGGRLVWISGNIKRSFPYSFVVAKRVFNISMSVKNFVKNKIISRL